MGLQLVLLFCRGRICLRCNGIHGTIPWEKDKRRAHTRISCRHARPSRNCAYSVLDVPVKSALRQIDVLQIDCFSL